MLCFHFSVSSKISFFFHWQFLSSQFSCSLINPMLYKSIRGDRNQQGACLKGLHFSKNDEFVFTYDSKLLLVCEWRSELKTSSRVNKSGLQMWLLLTHHVAQQTLMLKISAAKASMRTPFSKFALSLVFIRPTPIRVLMCKWPLLCTT